MICHGRLHWLMRRAAIDEEEVEALEMVRVRWGAKEEVEEVELAREWLLGCLRES